MRFILQDPINPSNTQHSQSEELFEEHVCYQVT